MSDLRRWKFQLEDENGDSHYLGVDDPETGDEFEFVGTTRQAHGCAGGLADEWEVKTGGLCLRLTLESQGKVNT